MFNHITHDKIEEVVRLAEQAERTPLSDAGGGPAGGNPPLRPQPAGSWDDALRKFLHALPEAALRELVDLYCDAAGSGPAPGAAAGDPAGYLLGRPDLAPVLRSGYMTR